MPEAPPSLIGEVCADGQLFPKEIPGVRKRKFSPAKGRVCGRNVAGCSKRVAVRLTGTEFVRIGFVSSIYRVPARSSLLARHEEGVRNE